MLALPILIAKDLRRRWRDPVGLLVMLAIPVAVLLIFRFAFGTVDSGKLPRAKLLLVDQDKTLISRFVKSAFSQERLAEMVEATAVDSAEAIRLLYKEQASAALFIPKGFADAYLNGRTATLRLIKNPSERILPRILEEIVATMADGGSALRDLLQDPLRLLVEGTGNWQGAPTEDLVSRTAVDIHRSGKYLLPPMITLRAEDTSRKEAEPSFLLIFFPGMVCMAILYLSQTLALDLAEERREGTLRRSLAAGRRAEELLLGKVIAGMVILGPLLALLFGLGRGLLGIPWMRLAGAWGLSVAAGFAVLSALHVLTLIPHRPNAANVVSNLVVLPLALLGGCFFPAEAMGKGLFALATRLPSGWVVERLKDVLLDRPRDPGAALIAVAVCLGGGLAFLLLAGRLAARRFAES